MERESFIFYKSFYEAIVDLPKEIKLEILTVIIEYALYGREPEDLKPFAKGMFALMKPPIDANTSRYENGCKGGARKRATPKPAPTTPPKPTPAPAPTPTPTPAGLTPAPTPAQTPYTATFADEVRAMKEEKIWLESTCLKFAITADEAARRLDRFLAHCRAECPDKPHPSFADAQRHFCAWMRKAYSQTQEPTPHDRSKDKYADRRAAEPDCQNPADFDPTF